MARLSFRFKEGRAIFDFGNGRLHLSPALSEVINSRHYRPPRKEALFEEQKSRVYISPNQDYESKK